MKRARNKIWSHFTQFNLKEYEKKKSDQRNEAFQKGIQKKKVSLNYILKESR